MKLNVPQFVMLCLSYENPPAAQLPQNPAGFRRHVGFHVNPALPCLVYKQDEVDKKNLIRKIAKR